MSNYLENMIIDHIFRGTTYTSPANLYVALLTTGAVDSDTGTNLTSGTGGTGIEVSASGTAYTRFNLNPSGSNWANTQGSGTGVSSGIGGTTSNSAPIIFSTATANWGTVVGVAVCDAPTNGNVLFYGTITIPKPVTSGDTFQFNANQLSIQIDT